MGRLISFGKFWYEFVVGDDWTIAAGVIVALAIAFVLTQLQLTLWWWMPVVVVLLLARSLQQATRAANRS